MPIQVESLVKFQAGNIYKVFPEGLLAGIGPKATDAEIIVRVMWSTLWALALIAC